MQILFRFNPFLWVGLVIVKLLCVFAGPSSLLRATEPGSILGFIQVPSLSLDDYHPRASVRSLHVRLPLVPEEQKASGLQSAMD